MAQPHFWWIAGSDVTSLPWSFRLSHQCHTSDMASLLGIWWKRHCGTISPLPTPPSPGGSPSRQHSTFLHSKHSPSHTSKCVRVCTCKLCIFPTWLVLPDSEAASSWHDIFFGGRGLQPAIGQWKRHHPARLWAATCCLLGSSQFIAATRATAAPSATTSWAVGSCPMELPAWAVRQQQWQQWGSPRAGSQLGGSQHGSPSAVPRAAAPVVPCQLGAVKNKLKHYKCSPQWQKGGLLLLSIGSLLGERQEKIYKEIL